MKSNVLLQIMLQESTCDTLTKMLIAHVLTMPKGDKFYYEKINVVVEFLEQCLPAHPGAFSAYFKILDLMPETMNRKVPEEMMAYVEANLEEIEKFYANGDESIKLPAKYRPSKIVQTSSQLVDVDGNPLSSSSPKLVLI